MTCVSAEHVSTRWVLARVLGRALESLRKEPACELATQWPAATGRLSQWIWSGAVAGAVGTAAMTMAMEGYFQLLPAGERDPLEPSQIVRQVTRLASVAPTPLARIARAIEGSTERHALMTLAAHFGYGTLGGIGYTCTMQGLRLPALVRGSVFGLGLFVVGYLGWLPTFGILRPATTFPRGQQAGLVTAHLVYGCVTASIADRGRNQLSSCATVKHPA